VKVAVALADRLRLVGEAVVVEKHVVHRHEAAGAVLREEVGLRQRVEKPHQRFRLRTLREKFPLESGGVCGNAAGRRLEQGPAARGPRALQAFLGRNSAASCRAGCGSRPSAWALPWPQRGRRGRRPAAWHRGRGVRCRRLRPAGACAARGGRCRGRASAARVNSSFFRCVAYCGLQRKWYRREADERRAIRSRKLVYKGVCEHAAPCRSNVGCVSGCCGPCRGSDRLPESRRRLAASMRVRSTEWARTPRSARSPCGRRSRRSRR